MQTIICTNLNVKIRALLVHPKRDLTWYIKVSARLKRESKKSMKVGVEVEAGVFREEASR